MGFLSGPRLEYKPTSKVLFPHGNLLGELRSIRRHHTSVVNQLIHIFSMTVTFAFVASTLVVIGKLFTFPLPILIFLLILFFPLPYLGFYWYLDPLVSIFWMPFFVAACVGSFFIADYLAGLMPLYAAIPASFGLALVALLPQLVGHLLLEDIRLPAFEFFEVVILTAFFLGYCGLGWISCWHIRRETIEQIWTDELAPQAALKVVEK